jgi:hypothetical protein
MEPMNEPVNMINPAHLNRAARGMYECLQGALGNVRINLVENTIQFVWHGATVQVLADAYWKQHAVVCWWITVIGPRNQKYGWPCTSNAVRAMVDIGMAMQFIEDKLE